MGIWTYLNLRLLQAPQFDWRHYWVSLLSLKTSCFLGKGWQHVLSIISNLIRIWISFILLCHFQLLGARISSPLLLSIIPLFDGLKVISGSSWFGLDTARGLLSIFILFVVHHDQFLSSWAISSGGAITRAIDIFNLLPKTHLHHTSSRFGQEGSPANPSPL